MQRPLNLDPVVISQVPFIAQGVVMAVLGYLYRRRRDAARIARRIYSDAAHIPPARYSVIANACLGGLIGYIVIITLGYLGLEGVVIDSSVVAVLVFIGAYMGDKLVEPLIIRLGEKEPMRFVKWVQLPGKRPAPLFVVSPEDGRKIYEAYISQPPRACKNCGSTDLSALLVSLTNSRWKKGLSYLFGYRVRPARECQKCGAGWIKLRNQDKSRTWVAVPPPKGRL